MAWKPTPILNLLLLICFHAAVSVSCFQLTDEILHFVPDCARECFLSFLDVNFEKNPCGGGFTSLQCLCANRGASGFTIGEGLVQCIAAEKAIQFCSAEESTDEVFVRAFGMCDGKPSAIPATNSIFTATLLLPPSGPGIVSFPPLTTTRTDFGDIVTSTVRSSTRPPSSEPTLETDTSEPPGTTAFESTTGFATSRRTSTSTEVSSTAEPVPDIPAGDDSGADGADEGGKKDDEASTGLGPAQVAGISVGVASAAGLALIAIFVARYYRRQRRLPDLRSLFSKRDTWPYPEKGGGRDGNPDGSGSMAGVARQIEQPLDGRDAGPGPGPPAYSGAAGFYSPAIGVAVASPRDQQRRQDAEIPTSRPLSRLLPAKPVYVPGGSGRRNSPAPSEAFRDATMVTSPARRREGSPQAMGSQRQQSPTPLTLADTIQTRQQPSPVPPASQQSPRRFPPTGPSPPPNPAQPPQPIFKTTYTAPTPKLSNSNKPQPPLPPPIVTTKLDAPPPAVLERDSAVTEFEEDGRFSSRSSKKNSTGGGQVWVPPSGHPSGLTYYFSDQNGNWVLRNSQSGQQQQQQHHHHHGYNRSSHNQDNIHPALRTTDSLAPAAEISRSSYWPSNPQYQPRSSSIYSPNLPRPLFSDARRSSYTNNLRASDDSGVTRFSAASSSGDMEPPPQGNLSPVAESPPEPVPRRNYPGSTFAAPNNSLGERRNPNNLRLAAGPPRSARPYNPPGQPSPTLGLMNPPPGPSKYQNPYSRAFYNNQQQTNPPSTLRAVSPSPDRDLLPSVTASADFVSPISPIKPSFPPSTSGPWRPPKQSTTLNPPPSQPVELPASSPTSSANTTTSSLLAKRLGPVRAADMSFPAVRPPSTQRKWQQDPGNGQADRGLLSPQTPGRGPKTPTWVPKLTPTRRGDDLFLNVQ